MFGPRTPIQDRALSEAKEAESVSGTGKGTGKAKEGMQLRAPSSRREPRRQPDLGIQIPGTRSQTVVPLCFLNLDCGFAALDSIPKQSIKSLRAKDSHFHDFQVAGAPWPKGFSSENLNHERRRFRGDG